MRIAYVINSLEGGGAAFPLPSITDLIRKAGHTVEVFALERRDGLALPLLDQAGVRVHVNPRTSPNNIGTMRWLAQSIRNFEATHIWTSLTRATFFGQLIGRRFKLPVISWQHSAFMKPANKRLLRTFRNWTDLWVGDSLTVTNVIRDVIGVDRSKIMTWPIFCANPQQPQSEAWIPGECVRIGSLGRLHPVKGYDVLAQALILLKRRADLPPFEVRIGGEGPLREELERLISDNNLTTLKLDGFIPSPGEFLAQQHLYVQPSLREGMCLAAHEAMAAGLGVVASAVGEMTSSIEDGVFGLVINAGDPEALAEALAKMLEKPEKLHAVGQAARARVMLRFSETAFLDAGTKILEVAERLHN